MYYRNSDYEHNAYDFVGAIIKHLGRLTESTYTTLF